ncbi:hypothetical protein [Vibrio sp. WXL210]|uniref:hypothetical protein n=1 Tax=Vibrio sp. WXL210 TaxID=3450709 RepID=UPI003EC5B7FB
MPSTTNNQVVNVSQILADKPSIVATHYHLKLKAYVSLVCDPNPFVSPERVEIYFVWCLVNEEWVITDFTEENTYWMLPLVELEQSGFASLVIPKSSDHCTLCNNPLLLHITRDGAASTECPHCDLSRAIDTKAEYEQYLG